MDNFNNFKRLVVPTQHGRVSVLTRAGEGPALMLLHGNGFSGQVFSALANDAAFSGMPIIIPDLPGHGLSENAPKPGQTYSFAGFAECMAEVAATIKLQDFLVFGWSLGGQIAVEMLDITPGLIGVATFGSAIVQRGPLGLINGFHFSRQLLQAGKAVMNMVEAEHFAKTCGFSQFTQSISDDLLRVDPAMRPALSRATLLGKGRDQRAIIASTQTPVCLMLGDTDPFISQSTFAKVASKSLFGGRTKLIKNCGHSPFGTAAEKIVPAIMHFYQHAIAVEKMPTAMPMRLAG